MAAVESKIAEVVQPQFEPVDREKVRIEDEEE